MPRVELLPAKPEVATPGASFTVGRAWIVTESA
jgi:hypothetical protein